MDKQIEKLKSRKKKLQGQLLKCTQIMIRGSLVKISRRCHNKSCSCYKGDTKHGFMYSVSIPSDKTTQMVYLNKDAATSKELSSALLSFKRFWKLSKQLALVNLSLYKLSFPQRKKRERR